MHKKRILFFRNSIFLFQKGNQKWLRSEEDKYEGAKDPFVKKRTTTITFSTLLFF